jgi:hypothetical protein
MFGVIAVACFGGFLAGLVVQKWGVVIMCGIGFLAFGWYCWMISPGHRVQPPSRAVNRYMDGVNSFMKIIRYDAAVRPDERDRKSTTSK